MGEVYRSILGYVLLELLVVVPDYQYLSNNFVCHLQIFLFRNPLQIIPTQATP